MDIDFGKFHKFTLARWWCDFNAWQWPHDYPVPKPEDWDSMPRHIALDRTSRTQFNVVAEQIEKIKQHITRGDMLKYWNGPYKRRNNWAP